MTQPRVARPPQLDMLRGLNRARRMQLIASMGLGKTGAALLHADWLGLHLGHFPGMLVLAPLQVGFSWLKEAPIWLPGLRVGLVAGTEKARKEALSGSCDITICTYDHLPWLEEHMGGKTANWSRLGKLCVPDESTRIKKTRASWQTSSIGNRWLRTDGGVQTNALARHAWDFDYWVNATGTPTPNGLIDLWGQYWYIDQGRRLGNSYTAFAESYFMLPMKHTEHTKPVPIPGTDQALAHLTADVTVVCRVEDYYDIAKPNVIDRPVELPAKARKQYADMRGRMQMQLESGQQVAVQTAGSKIVKCLQIACIAKGTPTLTQRGWVGIETVTAEDQVWDGVEWVSTEGAVANGVKRVSPCFSVMLTDDHQVLTTVGWRTTKEIHKHGKHGTQLSRAEVRYPDGFGPLSAPEQVHPRKAASLALRLRLRSVRSAARRGAPANPYHADERGELRLPVGALERNPWEDARQKRRPVLQHVAEHEITLQQPKRQSLSPLRGRGGYPLRRVERLSIVSGRHAAHVLQGRNAGQARWSKRVHPGELPVGGHADSAEQSQGQRVAGYAEGAHDATQRSKSVWAKTRYAPRTAKAVRGVAGGCAVRPRVERAEVYDLANCGPRHRFVVRGKDGEALIVHNCGFAYFNVDDDDNIDPEFRFCSELHDAKLDAIDSILEETGEPLVVVYFFKASLAMLQRKFKKRLRTLDKAGKVQDEWNAGKIEILAIQYAEGAYGLNLQHGGRNICMFSPTYIADHYAQIIERLGPLRQMQSGYNRVVNVFRLIAHNTEDMRVYGVAEGKISAEQALIEFMNDLQPRRN